MASDEATGWMVVRRVAGELVPQNDVLRASNVRRIEASTKAVATRVERRNSLAVAACDGDHAERNVVVDSTRGGNTKRREPKRSGSQGRRDATAGGSNATARRVRLLSNKPMMLAALGVLWIARPAHCGSISASRSTPSDGRDESPNR